MHGSHAQSVDDVQGQVPPRKSNTRGVWASIHGNLGIIPAAGSFCMEYRGVTNRRRLGGRPTTIVQRGPGHWPITRSQNSIKKGHVGANILACKSIHAIPFKSLSDHQARWGTICTIIAL